MQYLCLLVSCFRVNGSALKRRNIRLCVFLLFFSFLFFFCLDTSGAQGKAVRYRSCQLIGEILMAAPDDADIDDDLIDGIASALLARLEDRITAIRAVAARSLARCADPGEEGDFSGDSVTLSLIDIAKSERSKDVRKAAIGALPMCEISVPVLVERVKDVSEEVRRVAFGALAVKGSVNQLDARSLRQVVVQGLGEQSQSARMHASELIGAWFDDCSSDSMAFIASMQPNEDCGKAALLAVSELLSRGDLDARGIAQSARANADGFHKSHSSVLSSEEAIFWRAVVENLAGVAKEQVWRL